MFELFFGTIRFNRSSRIRFCVCDAYWQVSEKNFWRSKVIEVTKTYLPDKEKYKKYVDEIYASGWVTNYGPMVQRLEKRLADYLGVKNLILVSNGTAALEIAYRTLDLKGYAITTPFSFVATTSSLVTNGIKPIFADIDARTLNMDPGRIEELITHHTEAIVPVHVFGNGCEVEAIDAIAKAHGLKVIYDAAHAFGVTVQRRKHSELRRHLDAEFSCDQAFSHHRGRRPDHQ